MISNTLSFIKISNKNMFDFDQIRTHTHTHTHTLGACMFKVRGLCDLCENIFQKIEKIPHSFLLCRVKQPLTELQSPGAFLIELSERHIRHYFAEGFELFFVQCARAFGAGQGYLPLTELQSP